MSHGESCRTTLPAIHVVRDLVGIADHADPTTDPTTDPATSTARRDIRFGLCTNGSRCAGHLADAAADADEAEKA